MVKLRIKHFDHDGIADGGKFEKTWTADKDYIIKYIFFKRKDGASFTASDVTIWINMDPITLDHALCDTFDGDVLTGLPINEPLERDWEFKYEGYNREGTTISLVVELVLEEK